VVPKEVLTKYGVSVEGSILKMIYSDFYPQNIPLY
jgi:hypothetical protein